jgi:hypothetical protein
VPRLAQRPGQQPLGVLVVVADDRPHAVPLAQHPHLHGLRHPGEGDVRPRAQVDHQPPTAASSGSSTGRHAAASEPTPGSEVPRTAGTRGCGRSAPAARTARWPPGPSRWPAGDRPVTGWRTTAPRTRRRCSGGPPAGSGLPSARRPSPHRQRSSRAPAGAARARRPPPPAARLPAVRAPASAPVRQPARSSGAPRPPAALPSDGGSSRSTRSTLVAVTAPAGG